MVSIPVVLRITPLLLLALVRLSASEPVVSVVATVEQITDHVTTWRSTFGYWVEREARNARAGMATIASTWQRPVTLDVEFYFIGQRVQRSTRNHTSTLELYHYHKRTVTVPANGSIDVPTLSKVVVLQKMLAKDPEDRSSINGVKPYGWVVRVKGGGRVVAEAFNLGESVGNLDRILDKTPVATLAQMQKESEARVARRD